MNNLRRICVEPKEHADIRSHSASNPTEAKSPSSCPIPRTSKAAEFSTMTYFGLSSRMMRKYSLQSPDRSPSNPEPFPAKLMSWHGNPPQITSGRSKPSPVNVRTSSHRGTFGQCFANTSLQYSSISTCQTHRIPARSKPRSKAPDTGE